jgi:hypothetical protein
MRIVLWECQGRGCEDVESAVDVCVNDASPPKWGGLKLRAELNQIYHLLGMDTESSVLSVEAFADDLWTLLGRTDGTEPERPLWEEIHARAEEERALPRRQIDVGPGVMRERDARRGLTVFRLTPEVERVLRDVGFFEMVEKRDVMLEVDQVHDDAPDVSEFVGPDVGEQERLKDLRDKGHTYHCASAQVAAGQECGCMFQGEVEPAPDDVDEPEDVTIDDEERPCSGCFLCRDSIPAAPEPADTEEPGFVPDGGLVGDGWEESTPIEVGQVWIAKDPDAFGRRWTKVVVKEGPNAGGLYGVVPHDEPEYMPSFVTAESLRASMRLRVGGLAGGPADTLLPADIIPEATPIRPYLGGPDPFTAAGVQPEGSAGGPVEIPWVEIKETRRDFDYRRAYEEHLAILAGITSPGDVQAPAVLSVDPSAVPAVPVADTATDTDPTDPGGW